MIQALSSKNIFPHAVIAVYLAQHQQKWKRWPYFAEKILQNQVLWNTQIFAVN